jgi:hypothetical protein
MRHLNDGDQMESVRKHEALSTGLLVALGMTLGVCLGQAGTAKAILTHTHGHIRPVSVKTASRNRVTSEDPQSNSALPLSPQHRVRLPASGSAGQQHQAQNHTDKGKGKKQAHKPKHGKKPAPPHTGKPKHGSAGTTTAESGKPTGDHQGHRPTPPPHRHEGH